MPGCPVSPPIFEEPNAREPLHPGGLALTRRAAGLGGFQPGQRALDLGCGGGATVRWLAEAGGMRSAGIDLRLSALQAGATGQPGVNLVCAQAERLPFGDQTWDCLLAECSLSQVSDWRGLLAECHRVMVSHGCLVIGDLYWRGLPADNQAAPDGKRFLPAALDQSGWVERLAQAGFETRYWEDHTPALKALAAQALWAGRPLTSLWGCRPETAPSWSAAKQRQSGYFLLVAHKLE